MGYRELMGYPPVGHMMAVLVIAGEEETGKKVAGRLAKAAGRERAEHLATGADNAGHQVQIIGPAAAAIGRIGGKYRTVFYGKSSSMEALIQVRDRLEAVPVTEQDVTVQFDFDPMNSY